MWDHWRFISSNCASWFHCVMCRLCKGLRFYLWYSWQSQTATWEKWGLETRLRRCWCRGVKYRLISFQVHDKYVREMRHMITMIAKLVVDVPQGFIADSHCQHRGWEAQMIPIKIGQATGQFCSGYHSMLYKQCASFFIKQHNTKQSSTFFSRHKCNTNSVFTELKSEDFGKNRTTNWILGGFYGGWWCCLT